MSGGYSIPLLYIDKACGFILDLLIVIRLGWAVTIFLFTWPQFSSYSMYTIHIQM